QANVYNHYLDIDADTRNRLLLGVLHLVKETQPQVVQGVTGEAHAHTDNNEDMVFRQVVWQFGLRQSPPSMMSVSSRGERDRGGRSARGTRTSGVSLSVTPREGESDADALVRHERERRERERQARETDRELGRVLSPLLIGVMSGHERHPFPVSDRPVPEAAFEFITRTGRYMSLALSLCGGWRRKSDHADVISLQLHRQLTSPPFCRVLGLPRLNASDSNRITYPTVSDLLREREREYGPGYGRLDVLALPSAPSNGWVMPVLVVPEIDSSTLYRACCLSFNMYVSDAHALQGTATNNNGSNSTQAPWGFTLPVDQYSQSPLLYAAKHRCTALLRLLLSISPAGAALLDSKGRNSLHSTILSWVDTSDPLSVSLSVLSSDRDRARASAALALSLPFSLPPELCRHAVDRTQATRDVMERERLESSVRRGASLDMDYGDSYESPRGSRSHFRSSRDRRSTRHPTESDMDEEGERERGLDSARDTPRGRRGEDQRDMEHRSRLVLSLILQHTRTRSPLASCLSGLRPMHLAALRGWHYATVSLLGKGHALVSDTDAKGRTALEVCMHRMLCVVTGKLYSRLTAAKLCIESGKVKTPACWGSIKGGHSHHSAGSSYSSLGSPLSCASLSMASSLDDVPLLTVRDGSATSARSGDHARETPRDRLTDHEVMLPSLPWLDAAREHKEMEKERERERERDKRKTSRGRVRRGDTKSSPRSSHRVPEDDLASPELLDGASPNLVAYRRVAFALLAYGSSPLSKCPKQDINMLSLALMCKCNALVQLVLTYTLSPSPFLTTLQAAQFRDAHAPEPSAPGGICPQMRTRPLSPLGQPLLTCKYTPCDMDMGEGCSEAERDLDICEGMSGRGGARSQNASGSTTPGPYTSVAAADSDTIWIGLFPPLRSDTVLHPSTLQRTIDGLVLHRPDPLPFTALEHAAYSGQSVILGYLLDLLILAVGRERATIALTSHVFTIAHCAALPLASGELIPGPVRVVAASGAASTIRQGCPCCRFDESEPGVDMPCNSTSQREASRIRASVRALKSLPTVSTTALSALHSFPMRTAAIRTCRVVARRFPGIFSVPDRAGWRADSMIPDRLRTWLLAPDAPFMLPTHSLTCIFRRPVMLLPRLVSNCLKQNPRRKWQRRVIAAIPEGVLYFDGEVRGEYPVLQLPAACETYRHTKHVIPWGKVVRSQPLPPPSPVPQTDPEYLYAF
ncbi:hypothetical protein KIPB_006888, partial [Kipferlia bialata]